MGKPTEEELKEALDEAARMREAGEDPNHMAKALLNCHYRLTHAERVYKAAQEYIHSGMDQTSHSRLIKALDDYRTADTHPALLK